MVLPEKIVGVGIGLGSLLVPVTAAETSKGNVLRLRDLNGIVGSSTTDLVRFSGTLKVARGIVEQQKRSDIVEVPTSGLVSILDRIKALEDEVQALIDGKKVNNDNKAIEPSTAGTASGSTESPSSSDATPSDASSSDTGSTSSPSDGPQAGSSGSGDAASGSSLAGSSSAAKPSDAGSSDEGSISDDEDDCAPEHLLYNLGGGSLQRRSLDVSEHPLFRRTTNCTLDSIAGGKKNKGIPSGAAVFVEGSATVASAASAATGSDATESIDSTTPGATEDESAAAESAADKPSTLESQPIVSASSDADDDVVKLDGHTLSVTPVPSAEATAAPESNAKGKLAESDDDDDDDDKTTLEYTSTTTRTTTLYTTRTIHIRPGTTSAGAEKKFTNGTAIAVPSTPTVSASELVKNETAPSPSTNIVDSVTPIAESTSLLANDKTVSASTAELPKLHSERPVLQKNLTAPTSELSQSASVTSQVEESSTGASTSLEAETIASTSVASQPILEKNITAPTSDAETSVALASQGLPQKNETGAATPTDELTAAGLTSLSSLVNPHSSADVEEKLSVAEESATTSTMTSTVTLTVPGAATSNEATSGGVSPSTSSDLTPETTSALVSSPIFQNGTLERRQSGFKTVRSPRGMTSVADSQC